MQRVTNQMMNNTKIHNLNRHQAEWDKTQDCWEPVRTSASRATTRSPRSTSQMIYKQAHRGGPVHLEPRLGEVAPGRGGHRAPVGNAHLPAPEGAHRAGRQRIYSNFERKEAVATEINEMLEELVASQYRSATGRPIFGGFQTGTEDVPTPSFRSTRRSRRGTRATP